MARIDTSQYLDLESSAKILNRNIFTVRQWVKENMFDISDVIMFSGQIMIKRTAVQDLAKRLSD